MENLLAIEAIVIGTSAGGLYALSYILERLPGDFRLPIIIVQHRSKDQKELLEEVLQTKSRLVIKQADEKESIRAGYVYIAPPDYHLLVEKDRTLSLNVDDAVRFSRPSIDVLFESASEAYNNKLVSIVLTGASKDGAAGTEAVKFNKGITIAQDPSEAYFPYMPLASIETGKVDRVMKLEEITRFMLSINEKLE